MAKTCYFTIIDRLIANYLNNERACNYILDELKIPKLSNNVSVNPGIKDDPMMLISYDDQPSVRTNQQFFFYCMRELRHDSCDE